ncbi:MAG: hypothetical protein V4857_22165 [Pseudomonadota bacterium]
MSTTNFSPPYPRVAECYRALALAFGTKEGNRDVDALANKGDYDASLLSTLANDLIVTPLGRHVDEEFANLVGHWLDHMHKDYRQLVANVGVDNLARSETLPLLINHYFAPQANRFFVALKKQIGGPALQRLFDPACNPITVVLEWLDEGEEVSIVKRAYPTTLDQNRTEREKVRRWTVNGELPQMGSIKLLAQEVAKTGAVSHEKLASVRRWLVLGRALAYLDKQFPFRAVMLAHHTAGLPDTDIGTALSIAVLVKAQGQSELKVPGLMLYEDLSRLKVKQAGEQERTRLAIAELERLSAKHDPENNVLFHHCWLKARWHVFSGLLEKALEYYEQASDGGSYRAGPMLALIFEESLALAAFLGEKPTLKRLKHRAVAAGMFIEPKGASIVEGWEVDQFANQFWRLFPPQGRFPEAPEIDEDAPQFGFLIISEDELMATRPDFERPERVRAIRTKDGRVLRRPQLQLFASIGKADVVAALLEKGASVDQLDETGGSALLAAIKLPSKQVIGGRSMSYSPRDMIGQH